jgi:DNA repair protein RadA/Sms
MKKRGRPSIKNVTHVPSLIDFSQITPLDSLSINPRMLETMESGLGIDILFSEEGGIPCASNVMLSGDAGIGKTTVLLDVVASVQNKGRKCLFISGEMGRKQMFKYNERFPQFGIVTTLFTGDYIKYNTKDVIEQVLNQGYDLVLIDSIAEIIDGVRDDNNWDRKMAESWLIDTCTKNNRGENITNKFTTFLLIQQQTKAGDFVGSNKLKHMTDAFAQMKRESEKDGGRSYIEFIKNRNGKVGNRLEFKLKNSNIEYNSILENIEEENPSE